MKNAINLIVIFLISSISYGQNTKIDTTLQLNLLEKKLIAQIDTAELIGYYDKSEIGLENVFIQNLVLTLNSKKTFDFSFKRLTSCADSITKSCIRLIYSDDSLLRVFNWLSPTTGTMHHSPAIVQAKNKSGKILVRSSESNSEIDGDIGGGVTYFGIYRLRNSDRQLYVALGAGQASGRLPYETVDIFEIKADAICDTTSIIMYDGKLCHDILVDRESTRYDVNPQEIPPVEYDSKNQVITIPEIIDSQEDDENTRWSGKLVKLKFDGRLFKSLK